MTKLCCNRSNAEIWLNVEKTDPLWKASTELVDKPDDEASHLLVRLEDVTSEKGTNITTITKQS